MEANIYSVLDATLSAFYLIAISEQSTTLIPISQVEKSATQKGSVNCPGSQSVSGMRAGLAHF